METLIVWYDNNEYTYCVNIGEDSPMPQFETQSEAEAIAWAKGYKAAKNGNVQIILK